VFFALFCGYHSGMETIQQLLNRIHWDEEFGQGDFEVGIYDRIKDAVEFLPLERLMLEKGNHFSFTVCIEGESVTIPFHRIREVRKNGETIWKR
jgi:uncharacterized protein (UPF0248 family)